MFSLTSFLDTLTSVNPENVPKYVALVVVVLLVCFIARYAIPSFVISARFKKKAREIQLIAKDKPAQQLENWMPFFPESSLRIPGVNLKSRSIGSLS